MVYKFTSKGLMYLAGFICLITVVLAPFSIVFFILAKRAQIRIEGDNFIYRMFGTKVIPMSSITALRLKQVQQARQQIGVNFVNITSVLPLVIEYAGKKVTISLNHFEKTQEIVSTLEQKSGQKLQIPE